MKIWKSKLTDFGWQEKVKVYANGSIVLTRYLKGKAQDYIWIKDYESKDFLKFLKDNLK